MYGAPQAFASKHKNCSQFLRQRCATVLHVHRPKAIALNVGEFRGPRKFGEPAMPRPVRLMNPSVVAAPEGLCPRCAYVATVRADVLHQCDTSSPLFDVRWQLKRIASAAFFKGTILLVLDAQRRVLDWTWLISRPHLQVATWAGHGREFVHAGAAGSFAPPWNQQVYDARLLNADTTHILVTYNCASCHFSVSPLHLQRELTREGGLRKLQAWTPQRVQLHEPWLQGRNQALFMARRRPGSPRESVLIQPWIGIIGSLGAPKYATSDAEQCYGAAYDGLNMDGKRLQRWVCGLTRPNRTVRGVARISNEFRGFGYPAEVVLVEGAALVPVKQGKGGGKGGKGGGRVGSRVGSRGGVKVAAATASAFGTAVDKGGPTVGLHADEGIRISATAHLIRISKTSNTSPVTCAAFLGIGHLHRGKYHTSAAFKFGSRYTHFWYTLSTRPPYQMLSSSAEFCIESSQDPADCESVQFVTGLHAPGNGTTALVSYGINDCEAVTAEVPLERIWDMLLPLPGQTMVCTPTPEWNMKS